jgi:hypothetical protein
MVCRAFFPLDTMIEGRRYRRASIRRRFSGALHWPPTRLHPRSAKPHTSICSLAVPRLCSDSIVILTISNLVNTNILDPTWTYTS